MVLRNITDILIHLESFRNIDLYEQGLYHLRISVYQSISGLIIPASPYNLIRINSNSEILQSHINDFSFESQKFYIKFCDEEVLLQDIVVFRTEFEYENDYRSIEFVIQVDLVFMDCETEAFDVISIQNTDKTIVCSDMIRINQVIEGINQFYPIVFDDDHICVIAGTVHVLPMDFRFRSSGLFESIANTAISVKTENSIDLPKSIEEYLFKHKNELTQDDINKVYDKYVKSLESVYEKNKNWILKLHEEINYQNFSLDSYRILNEKIKIPHIE